MNPWRNYLCFNPKGWVIAGHKVVWVTRNLEAVIKSPEADVWRNVRTLSNYCRMRGLRPFKRGKQDVKP